MKLLLGLLVAHCAFGQLSGTVRNSASKLPVEKAKVSVFMVAKAKTAETDSTGAFLFDDLPPGKYMVSFSKAGFDDGSTTLEVKPGGNAVTLELNPWAEAEGLILDDDGRPLEGVAVYVRGGLRDTTDKTGHYRAGQIPPGQMQFSFQLPYELRRKTAIHDAKTGETLGYPSTMFYPGVADRTLSAPVAIMAGAHMAPFNVRLRRTRLVEVKGKVVGALPETEIELGSGGNRPDKTYARRKLDEHGRFLFDLLLPGEQTLIIYRNGEGDDLPYITTAVPGLDVVLPPFVNLEGIVRTAHPELQWAGPLRVRLGRLGYNMEERVDEGRFTMRNVPPGTWQLTIEDNLVRLVDDPKHRVYAAAVHGSLDRDARGQMLRVTESGNPPLEIELTDQTGKLTGTSDDPNPVIAVSPSGSAHPAFPRPDGSFTVDLPPGEYDVAKMGASCKTETVTIEPAGTTTIHLKACGK